MLSEPTVVISTTISNQMQRAINLICHSQNTTSSCSVTKMDWTGPNGNSVMSVQDYGMNKMIVRTVVVPGGAPGGPYTCTIYYAGGSAKNVYN